MPKIVINEKDQTSPTAEQLSEDIVFIPGFANVNGNVYISTTRGETPKDGVEGTGTKGTIYKAGDTVDTANDDPSIFSNTVDLKSWQCKQVPDAKADPQVTTYVWTALDTYVAPHPENEIVVCYTTEEFQQNFGTEPAKFSAPQDLTNNCSDTAKSYAFENVEAFRAKDDIDLSYTMAMECLTLGLPVAYVNITKREAGAPYVEKKISDLYDTLPTVLADLADPDYVYTRYITSGAYPSFEMQTTNGARLDKAMIATAKARQDAYAIIDHGDNSARPLSGTNSVISQVRADFAQTDKDDNSNSYGAMFTPWGTYNITNLNENIGGGTQSMPASFAYLCCLGKALSAGNPAYLAIANIGRGKPPFLTHLNTTQRLSSTIANTAMQSDTAISINPITNINPYGLVIYGNNTLKDNAFSKGKQASSDLNIRNLVSRVTKLLRDAAQQIIFEPNTDALWVTFKGRIMPSLDTMVTNQGLKRYNIVRVDSSNPREVKAKVYLFPVYAVEKVTIDLILSDAGITVEGGNE